MQNQLNKYQPILLSILRIVVAFLFIQHGTGKFFSLPDIGMNPTILSIYGFAGVLEVVGGLLLLIGLFTRPVALILSGQMAVAYFMFHASSTTFLTPLLNEGEPAVIFCFIFLYLVFAGSGKISLDNLTKISH